MCYTFEYYPAPGIAHDIAKMLYVKLSSPNEWQEMLTTLASHEYYTNYIQNQVNSFPDPSSDLVLFTHIPISKKHTFLSQIIAQLIDLDFRSFSLDTLIEYFSHIDQVKNDLYTFYFCEQDYSKIDFDHIIRNNKTIPDKIKILLFGFSMYPNKYISNLVKVLTLYYQTIKKQFNFTSASMIDLAHFVNKTLNNTFQNDLALHQKLHSSIISYSLCYSTPTFLYSGLSSNPPYFITTTETIQLSLKKETATSINDLIDVAQALGDKHRISIINQLASRNALTLSEITYNLDLSSTAVKYHIAILRKANLITSTHNSRQLYYSLNPIGFKNIRKALKQYEKGDQSL